jgi:hypothetical protein
MFETWHQFKICGPLEEGEILTWAFFGQRHDGAVFWSALSVAKHQDFWSRFAIVADRFDKCFSYRQAPESAFVPFKEVGPLLKGEDGYWHFK